MMVQNVLDFSLDKPEVDSVKSWNAKLIDAPPVGAGSAKSGNGKAVNVAHAEACSGISWRIKPVDMASIDTKTIDSGYFVHGKEGNLNGIRNDHHVGEKHHCLSGHSRFSTQESLGKHSGRPTKSNGYVIPPYVKPKIDNAPTMSDTSSGGDQPAQNILAPANDKFDGNRDTSHPNNKVSYDDEKPRPSVKKFQKPPVLDTDERASLMTICPQIVPWVAKEPMVSGRRPIKMINLLKKKSQLESQEYRLMMR